MIVDRIEIPPGIIEGLEAYAFEACKERGFTAALLCERARWRLEANGLPAAPAYRLADRLIQKWRKAGKIRWIRVTQTWEPVK